jgi:AcrR family transcriptional regulator
MTVADGALRIDSERTRQEILRAARELFREAGYENVRMADVAERAGCVRATLYNHFPNRDALLEALCSEYLEGFLEIHPRVRAWARPEHTIFEVLRETIAEELRWRVANGELREALDTARRLRKEFYVERNQRIDDALLAWFGAIHRASRRQGFLRSDVNLPFAEKAVYAMIDSVVAEFPVRTSQREITRAADQVARWSWYALYVAPPEESPRFEAIAGRLPAASGSAARGRG